MRLWLFIVLLLASALSFAAEVYKNTVPVSQAIWLGSEIQPYRAGLIIKQEVELQAGQVALYTAEAEGSIYVYPKDVKLWQLPLFISSMVVVFEPGVMPPALHPLTASFTGGVRTSPVQGVDVGRTFNYYAPVSRSGAFKASFEGVWTVCLYMWGGANGAGSGNAAWVYDATAQMTVVVP